MNVHLRNTLFYSLFGLCLLAGHSLFGQNIDPPEQIEVIEGQSYDYRYFHYWLPNRTRMIPTATTFNHGSYNSGLNQPNRISANEYQLIYTADKGTIGRDTFTIEYYTQTYTQTIRKVIVNVLPSRVNAEDDFIAIPLGASMTIPVETNDYSNRGVLNITDISVENNGIATIQNNSVVFTPDFGYEGLANFNYVVCDDVGTCDKATVHVAVGDPNAANNSVIDLITIKNKPIPILTPLGDYTLSQGPTNGDTTEMNGILYYEPNSSFVGMDQLKYVHNSNGNTKIIDVDVLNIDAPNQFVNDDVEYTFENEIILINILENDYLGPALHNVQANNPSNGTLTQIPGLKGVYTYQPNSGFSGIDEFTYTASSVANNGNTETGVVNIIVSNLNPAQAVFSLQTPENTPLVLDYNIAPTNYAFQVTNQGNKGTATFYPNQLSTTINNHLIQGYNLVVYTPNSGATGIDEFEMEYCVGGGTTNCTTVKVEVDIQSIVNGNICAGSDCVWAGDANRDGVVDLRDMLPTGWCIGEVGYSRANATINPWVGQESPNWGIAFPHSNIDLKNLDANGDSLINVADTMAISEHYQRNHSLSPEPINFPANIPLFLGNPDTIYVTGPGDIVRIPIILGDPNLPAENMYGLTFSIDFDPSIIDATASSINFDAESWANYTSPVLNMVKKPFTGRMDAAYTRTNGITTDGYGRVGAVDFIIVEDLEFQRIPDKSFARISGSYYNGAGVYTQLPESLVAISFKQEAPKETSAELLVFPNPTSDYLNYRIVGAQEPYDQVEVYDLTGKSILQGTHDQFNGQINTSQYTSGVYLMRVSTSNGVVTKKFEVISGR